MKPRISTIGAALFALSLSLPALGEVSAKLDDAGNYVGMVYRIGMSARVWACPAPTLNRKPLNPTGDLLGDLAPTIVEDNAHARWPFAVWAHPNGSDYDLVFSRWTGRAWTPMAFVDQDNAVNDLDPRLVMSSTGHPYMVWYRAEATGGAIYFSMFLQTRWISPIRLSTVGVDSSQPDLTLPSDWRIVVTFMTPSGMQTRAITIQSIDSITDDIDPKVRMQIVAN